MQNLKALNDQNKLLYHKPIQRRFIVQTYKQFYCTHATADV